MDRDSVGLQDVGLQLAIQCACQVLLVRCVYDSLGIMMIVTSRILTLMEVSSTEKLGCRGSGRIGVKCFGRLRVHRVRGRGLTHGRRRGSVLAHCSFGSPVRCKTASFSHAL